MATGDPTQPAPPEQPPSDPAAVTELAPAGAGDLRDTVYLPLDDVPPAPRNPKQHDLPQLIESIREFGFVTPGIIDARTGLTVVGHGRTQALKEMREAGEAAPRGVLQDPERGWLVPVITGWASASDEQAERFLVADNRHAELGGWDNDLLTQMLSEFSTLDGTGYNPEDLDDLLKTVEVPDLDKMAAELGEPDPADTWPTVKVRVPPHVAAAWRTHLDSHDGDEVAALAALLEVDPADAGESDWQP